MIDILRAFKKRYRYEPATHIVFALLFASLYCLSYFKVEGFVIPLFLMKLIVLLVLVSLTALLYCYFVKRPRKLMLIDICDDNGKPYALDPKSVEFVEDLTTDSGKPTTSVTMKSGKMVVLNVSTAKFITKFKAIQKGF